jgi:hypothetical protein
MSKRQALTGGKLAKVLVFGYSMTRIFAFHERRTYSVRGAIFTGRASKRLLLFRKG